VEARETERDVRRRPTGVTADAVASDDFIDEGLADDERTRTHEVTRV
jgi:hypothetical protein